MSKNVEQSDFEIKSTSAKFPPTPEQENVIELAAKMEGLKIDAFAGAAKTSTLLMVAEHIYKTKNKRGQYIAFNKKNASDSQLAFIEFGGKANTFHSLAFAKLSSKSKNRVNNSSSTKVVNWLKRFDINPISFGQNDNLSSNQVAAYLLSVITNYCSSADYEINEKHFSLDKLDLSDSARKQEDECLAALRSEYIDVARRIWSEITNERSDIPILHDHYGKIWAREHPQIIPDGYIMYDEAQDANPVMIDLLVHQDSPVIWTGDRHQQIYSWRGAVNAMAQIKVPHTANLTQSFRFGERTAALAGAILAHKFGEERILRGFDKLDTKIYTKRKVPPDTQAILCRTNAAIVANIIELMKQGQSVVCDEKAEIEQYLVKIRDIEQGKRMQGSLAHIKNRDDLIAHLKEESSGASKAFISAIAKGESTQSLINLVRKCKGKECFNKEKDIFICTAHKSKGMEWDNVFLASDLEYTPRELQGKNAQEKMAAQENEFIRLMYVAATRAQKKLYLSENAANALNLYSNGKLRDVVSPVGILPVASSSIRGLLKKLLGK